MFILKLILTIGIISFFSLAIFFGYNLVIPLLFNLPELVTWQAIALGTLFYLYLCIAN